MTGGVLPVNGGVVMVLNSMDRIIEIDKANFVAVVEPGVVTGDLHRAVEKKGLFYPPDPASSAFCTIGGNVGECAGGPRAVKYGVTRDYVLGLEAVLASVINRSFDSGSLLYSFGKNFKATSLFSFVSSAR